MFIARSLFQNLSEIGWNLICRGDDFNLGCIVVIINSYKINLLLANGPATTFDLLISLNVCTVGTPLPKQKEQFAL